MNKVLGKICAFTVLAFIANVLGVCEDDLVPLEAGKLPSEWNVGTIPQLFYNTRQMRGVAAYRDFKILGLDTVVLSLKFCPVSMTIYGNLTARRIQLIGYFSSGNLDYFNHGAQILVQGDSGFLNMTLTNIQMKNIIAPLRYSRATKKLEIGNDMEYEAIEEVTIHNLTKYEADEEDGHHGEGKQEFFKVEKSTSYHSLVEFVKHIINFKAQRGSLMAAANQVFANAFSM